MSFVDLTRPQTHQVPDAEYIHHASARAYFEEAYDEHMNGFYETAINLYQKSINAFPTAQAYCFMAWAFNTLGEIEKSIALCQEAIQIDPEYGNPYNDMGVYLLQTGDDAEAIYWFEKAISAPKYHCKFYPLYNLGKIYVTRNMIQKALSCYRLAIELEPDFELAKEEYETLLHSLN